MINKDSVSGTFIIAGGLCLVASLMVSIAAVALKPVQDINKALDRKGNILMAAGLYDGPKTIDKVFAERVNTKLYDFEANTYTSKVNAETYDDRKAAKDPSALVKIPPEKDLAKIRTRAPYGLVYEIKDASGKLEKIVLPIHGKGLWSTMYGFIAVGLDGNSILGLGFYEHGETPGLGGEIDNPEWKKHWPGKKIYGSSGNAEITVIKGSVDKSKPSAAYQVDGISGATITGRGVGALVQYWMGEHAYGGYLKSLAKTAGT